MCNYIHIDNKSRVRKIKSDGIGWKLFYIDGSSLTFRKGYQNKDKTGWVKWMDKYAGDGFCFFRTKNEALRAQGAWSSYSKLEKIEYRKGLVSQREAGFTGDAIRMALCKEFRVDEKGE